MCRLWDPSSFAIWLHTAGFVSPRWSPEPAHLARRRLRLEEPPDGVAQLFLLVGEGEVTVEPPEFLGIGRPNANRTTLAPGHAGTPSRYPSSVPRPAHYETPTVRIDKLVVGPYENNVYVVRCTGTGDAVIIDAANEHELLLEVSRATGVRRVLTTHGHWDHIQAVEAVRGRRDRRRHRARRCVDAPRLRLRHARRRGDRGRRPPAAHDPHPGHTPGSTSFPARGPPDRVQRRHVCSQGGPGNTSLPGGDFEQIIDSIAGASSPASGPARPPRPRPRTPIGTERRTSRVGGIVVGEVV